MSFWHSLWVGSTRIYSNFCQVSARFLVKTFSSYPSGPGKVTSTLANLSARKRHDAARKPSFGLSDTLSMGRSPEIREEVKRSSHLRTSHDSSNYIMVGTPMIASPTAHRDRDGNVKLSVL